MIIKTAKFGSITSMIILIILAFCCQTAIARGNQLIETDRDTYNSGEEIRVNYSHASGSRDWICIVPEGSLDTDAGDYQSIPAIGRGVLIFKSPGPGRYEARAYYDYSPGRYVVTDRYRFTVVDHQPDHGQGDWHGGIRDRIDQAHQRIEQGIEQGTLTRHEAEGLKEELDSILIEIDRMKADGRIDHRERERINRDLDRLNRDIGREKHNDNGSQSHR